MRDVRLLMVIGAVHETKRATCSRSGEEGTKVESHFWQMFSELTVGNML